VSGTSVENIDGQLRARPGGWGSLHLCCNRGSEVFEVAGGAPVLVARREATEDENRALDRAASDTVDELRSRGLDARVVADRLNRRKIDLIPVPRWADPKKADIAALVRAVLRRLAASGIRDLGEVVDLAMKAAWGAGLGDPRVTSDVKHVEIGLTDKSDSARFAARWLAERGVTGRLVLVAGDELGALGGVPGSDSRMLVPGLARARVVSVGVEPTGVPDGVVHLRGGPARFLALLDLQLERRAGRRVPQVDPDPGWVLALSAGPAKERVAEALGALGNGSAGTRASREEGGPERAPLFAVNGGYGGEGRQLHGPIWTDLDFPSGLPAGRGLPDVRVVDLRTGVLVRRVDDGGFRSLRFLSAEAPQVMGLRAEAKAGSLRPGPALTDPGGSRFRRTVRGSTAIASTEGGGCQIGVAATDIATERDGRVAVERLAAWELGAPGPTVGRLAARRVAAAASVGFDQLLSRHRAAWAARWRDADVTIDGASGAEADQLAARFAVFHLLGAAADRGEAAVGARGLTGDAYEGHVFWDADVFVLPALAAIRPEGARAMLEYRIRRLPAARAAAAARGLAGARFPWESAGDGRDVTPRLVHGANGEPIAILTGTHEEHIVADVAWAAERYAAWSGDAGFLAQGPGRDLVVDTARYWASRIRLDRSGRGHLYGVMGPDEYHEVVDDDAYTNVMARWNLERGALLLEATGGRDEEEAQRWRKLAGRLVDGWDPDRHLYEQFAGYFGLEPLRITDLAHPPVAADVLLGHERVAGSQVIKQADVLMLHHLVPTAVVPGSLAPCLDFYEPRTAHGSSLSPAISASLLARANRPEAALELFRTAARLDLDDITGTTAGGLHLATMGGLWQSLAYGFLGLRAETDGLEVDPHLPEAWTTLSLSFRYRGQRVTVAATHEHVDVAIEAPLGLRLADHDARRYEPPGAVLRLPSARPRSKRAGSSRARSSRAGRSRR
jgi:hypothetical protein